MMTDFFKTVRDWIFYWRGETICLPVVIIALWGICWGVLTLTGRPLLNDIGSLVDFGIGCVKIMMVGSLVAFAVKTHHGYRTESGTGSRPSMADDIYDSCVTAFYYVLFSVLLFWFA